VKRYVIAVDIGGTNLKGAIVKDGNKIMNNVSVPTKGFKNRNALINGILSLIRSLLRESGIAKKNVAGVGIGAAGLIDSKKGVIRRLVNIKGFNNVPLKAICENKTGLKTYLDNDVNVMTLGELHHGAGKGAQNMLCITLGTGVGGGIVVNGKLYRGSCLSAGEIGHMPLNESGPRCNCGGFGCMEKFVGNNYIIQIAKRYVKSGKKTKIKALVKGNLEKITPKIISKAAKRNDKVANAIWSEIGTHLGVTLSGVINLLNPDRIVIGGGVAGAGQDLFKAIRMTINQRAMKVPAKTAKIVKAQLGQNAGVIGAAVLVRSEG